VDHYSSSTLTALCKISFDVDLPDTDTDGLCWQALFRNKVLVQGYPAVANRKDGLHGLDTRCITWFNGLPFVKGFSALAVPTKVEEGTFLWHLLVNEDRSHVSYTDSRIYQIQPKARQITCTDLENSRHILGWCANATSLTGIVFPKWCPCRIVVYTDI
jgi:hypothetical protein